MVFFENRVNANQTKPNLSMCLRAGIDFITEENGNAPSTDRLVSNTNDAVIN